MKKFKELVQSLDEVKKFKLPRGEEEVDSYRRKVQKEKKYQSLLQRNLINLKSMQMDKNLQFIETKKKQERMQKN